MGRVKYYLEINKTKINYVRKKNNLPVPCAHERGRLGDNSAMNVPSRAFSNVPSVTDSNVPLQMWLL